MRREYKWVDHLPAMITHSSQPPSQLPNCEPTHSTQFRHISPIYPVKLPISTYTLFHLPTCHLGSSTYPLKRVFLTFLPTPLTAPVAPLRPHRRATAPCARSGDVPTIRTRDHPVIRSSHLSPILNIRSMPADRSRCMCACACVRVGGVTAIHGPRRLCGAPWRVFGVR